MDILSLTHFLDQANCQYRVYDLGRKVSKIPSEEFKQVELNQKPYPYPLQQHAWLALAFWNLDGGSQERYLWFLKFPLDERGLLKTAAQTHFIQLVVEALGKDLNQEPSELQKERLASNPFTFKPSQEKSAAFHARLSKDLVRPASRYYEDAQAYFSGQLGWHNWQNIGLQGIADFSVRLDDKTNSQSLCNALPYLPQEPLTALCQCLEHQNFPTQVSEALFKLAQELLAQEQLALSTLLIRALSSCQAVGLREQLLTEQQASLLYQDADWYVAIAGRCWSMLENESVLSDYLEGLAKLNNDTLFAQLYADLVAIPSLRHKLLAQLRNEHRSDILTQAIGRLFRGQQK